MPDFNESSDLQRLEERLRHSKPQTEPLPPTFKAKLRASLLANTEHTMSSENFATPHKKLAYRLTLAATVAALLLLVIITPAGQIIADAVLRFGPFTLTDAPSAAERSITATPSEAQPVRTETMTLTEADEQADFTVLYPRYLPADYQPPDPPTVEVAYNQRGDVASVELMLFSQDKRQILYYTQTPYTPDPSRSPFELGIGAAKATPVTVGDDEGVWLEDFSWGVEANNPLHYTVLLWQSTRPDGETFLFWLGSEAQLPLTEMLQIAESMAPAADGPTNALNIPFGDGITLLGFELTDETLELFWQTNAPQAARLMSFVHWRDSAGMIAAQIDRPHAVRPGASNQVVIESYDLRQPNLSPGDYTLFVGLYNADTGQRLPVTKFPNNEVRLTEIQIK